MPREKDDIKLCSKLTKLSQVIDDELPEKHSSLNSFRKTTKLFNQSIDEKISTHYHDNATGQVSMRGTLQNFHKQML